MAKKKTKNNSSKNSKKSRGPITIIGFILLIIISAISFAKHNDGNLKNSIDTVTEKVSKEKKEIEKNISSKIDSQKKSKNNSSKKETVKTSSKETQQTKATNGKIALPKNLENPLCSGSKNVKDHQIRHFSHYSICYRESYEQAEWSAYRLTSDQLVKNASRSNDFREDPEIKTQSATLADYKGSGYDRGHLTPAADMSFSEQAMSETFYMSNMSPQAGSFNRGIWKDLEAEVRNWTKKFGRVYVVSGPILEKPASAYEKIGKSAVTIPQYYYKVILAPLYADATDRKNPEESKAITSIGFILPNNDCKGKTFWDFACSVDKVEKRTGLDFYSLLEDSAENETEQTFNISLWK